MSKDNFTTRWNSYLLRRRLRTTQNRLHRFDGFGEKFAMISSTMCCVPGQEILEAIDEAAKRYPYIDTAGRRR